MKRFKYIAAGMALALSFFSCSDKIKNIPDARAIKFSIAREWPGEKVRTRANSPAVFGPGDGIGVFACYRPKADAGTMPSFTSNFMRNQLVSFDGSAWSYSPLKYWPADGSVEFQGYFPYNVKYNTVNNGLQTINHECKTGFEPLYVTRASVNAANGSLSGDGIGENGSLQLGFSPLLNKVNFTAKAKDGLFDEIENEEYKDCRFLIKEFRVWGFYREAQYAMETESWSGHDIPYKAEASLDMTQSLALKNMEETVPGYVYNPDNGYCTDKAVVIVEGKAPINIFDKSAYFIPMDGVIPDNDPGFEIMYVVLTNKKGENVYKESGIVTRTGSLREIFEGKNGLIKKIINVNLEFTVDGVTVTRDLEDYIYKPMF